MKEVKKSIPKIGNFYKGYFMAFLAILGVVIGLTARNVEKTNELEKQVKEQRELASEKTEQKTENEKQ